MNFNNLSARLKWYFRHKATICVSISLTHVNIKERQDWIRRMFQFLRDSFSGCEIIEPDFDLKEWKPRSVGNLYVSTERRVKSSDLMIVIFYMGEGSDGRGVEVAIREQSGKPMLAFALDSGIVSPVMTGCFEKTGVEVVTIASYNEMEKHIRRALFKIKTKYWVLSPYYLAKSLFVAPSH